MSWTLGRHPTWAIAVLITVLVTTDGSAITYGDRDSRQQHVDEVAPSPRADGAGGRAGPTGEPCLGVAVATGDNPHHVLRMHPPGTTYCFEPGVHRLRRPLRPQRGDTIAGEPGAVLNGSRVLTGWKAGVQGWTAPAFLPSNPSNDGPCLATSPFCGRAEEVFLQDRRLVRVASPERVTPDTFYADDAEGSITIGTDPRGLLVEQAVASGLVASARDRVTVRDLVLEKAANGAQVAAVDSRQDFPRSARGWRVLHNDVRLNHGVGVGIGSRGRVRGNLIHDQGQLGVSAWGTHVRLVDNEIAYNGWAGYDPEWEAGGIKAWMTVSAVISGNHVHHNQGPGVWSDGGCDRTEYTHNVITDNWMAGIQHEISYDALIAHNEILRNGSVHKGWAWEAGIQIQSSGGNELIEVRRNVVADNTHGIVVLDSSDRRLEDPHPAGPHIVQNVLVHDNVVVMGPGQWTGVVHDWGGHGVFRRGLRFRGNTYHVDSREQRSFAWEDELLTWDEWRAPGVGHDKGGELLVVGP